jgi:hypothetical protein
MLSGLTDGNVLRVCQATVMDERVEKSGDAQEHGALHIAGGPKKEE